MPGTNDTTDIDLDFSQIKAIFLNCTLKPSLHTEGLIRIARAIMPYVRKPELAVGRRIS